MRTRWWCTSRARRSCRCRTSWRQRCGRAAWSPACEVVRCSASTIRGGAASLAAGAQALRPRELRRWQLGRAGAAGLEAPWTSGGVGDVDGAAAGVGAPAKESAARVCSDAGFSRRRSGVGELGSRCGCWARGSLGLGDSMRGTPRWGARLCTLAPARVAVCVRCQSVSDTAGWPGPAVRAGARACRLAVLSRTPREVACGRVPQQGACFAA
jgi:hypothetical protein